MAKVQFERDVRFYRLELDADWNARVILIDEDGGYIEKEMNIKEKEYKDKFAKALSSALKDVFDIEDNMLIIVREGDDREGV